MRPLVSLVTLAAVPAALATTPTISPADPLTASDQLSLWLIGVAVDHPWLATLIGLVGVLRLCLKPVMTVIQGYVESTEDDADDEQLARVTRSPWFAVLIWAIDWLGSIKVPVVSRVAGDLADGPRRVVPVLVGLLLLLPACVSTPRESDLPTRVERGVKTAVYLTALGDLQVHPERRPAYAMARNGLAVLISEERWDPTAFANALAGTTYSQFAGESSLLILALVPVFQDLVTGDRIDLRESRYVEAGIRGAAAGLDLALALRPVFQAPPPPASVSGAMTSP